jgi:hypothetical protein
MHYRQPVLAYQIYQGRQNGQKARDESICEHPVVPHRDLQSLQSNNTNTQSYEQAFYDSFIEIFGILNILFDNVELYPFLEFMNQSKNQNATSQFYCLPVSPTT